ncbi:hypothetical protein ANME2D_01987 [Candidatus Methanoperedens nitroreducens]|uniref:RiboL-PSP-HEPN domain-containing protein n=1 Tax=Candidatus Methanoperedens nitratireducens TaxID=1392998 RepID=A0A062UYE4_9EURY|nr:MAE_28990/MAE_18760 family HEPN-like nuclease [Candidatus Methanoperedens nitroreducens]KCZ71931.1 hypothetical protein ANME2D_01987 [Candidatus Methanoperedens nitroreducens]MDJ1422094.1 MAE_28990/MAE_18760 family HEPN-like nuclease [Candidatus Methanoperedens sp.]
MKIQNVEVLANYLDSDLGWRKKELTFIVSSMSSTNKRNIDIHLRIGIAILYAHWEGYIKNAGTYYVIYIKQLGLRYDELRENFIALALRNTFCTCLETNKTSTHTKLVNILVNNLSTIANIPYYDVIDTQSNLRWKVFKEILDTLGLEDSFYITKDKQINKLVDNRNDVAHGQRVYFDEDEFLNLYNEVTNMLDCFKEQIIQAASEETFKRNF